MADLLSSYFAPNFPEDKGDRASFSLHRTYSGGLENRKPTTAIEQKKPQGVLRKTNYSLVSIVKGKGGEMKKLYDGHLMKTFM